MNAYDQFHTTNVFPTLALGFLGGKEMKAARIGNPGLRDRMSRLT